MKKLIILLFLGAISQTFFLHHADLSHAKNQNETGKIHFLFAFGALSAETNYLVPVDQNTLLKTGDRIKFFLDIRSHCHLYLIYRGAQDELTLLFPPTLEPADFSWPARHYVPENELWFELDSKTGKETFYLLAASKRLKNLESLYRAYSTATDPRDRQKCLDDIIAKIQSLRAEHRMLTATAERPVRLGGSIRGLEKAPAEAVHMLRDMATEILASEFYSRVFSIDHR